MQVGRFGHCVSLLGKWVSKDDFAVFDPWHKHFVKKTREWATNLSSVVLHLVISEQQNWPDAL